MLKTAEYYSMVCNENLKPIDYERLRLVSENVLGSVLDIGCGSGELLALVDGNGLKVGVEVNKIQAVKAKAIIADAESPLPFKDMSFDTICCLEVLEHLERPDSLMKEISRICRHRIIITVPHKEEIKPVRCVNCGLLTSVHLRSFNDDDLYSLVSPLFKVTTLVTINRSAILRTVGR